MLSGNMKAHLDQIIDKINQGHNFGVIRPSDGEYLILNNHTITVQAGDDWTFNSNGILKEHLMNAIKTINPNLYIGIPCNTCGHSPAGMYHDYIERFQVQKSQLTYANVFCNANWPFFVDFLKSYNKGFHLITAGTNECDFPIKSRLIIDKFLVNRWDDCWEKETTRVFDFIKNIEENQLICFASGPLTKIWIPKCMEMYPNNTYLDIGSAMDIFTKGDQNARPYTNQNTHYSKEVCNFA